MHASYLSGWPAIKCCLNCTSDASLSHMPQLSPSYRSPHSLSFCIRHPAQVCRSCPRCRTFDIHAARWTDLSVTRFSLVWLTVMTLFPLTLLLLKFNRGRLTRSKHISVLIVFFTLAVAATMVGGNIAIDPTTIGYVDRIVYHVTTLHRFFSDTRLPTLWLLHLSST